MSRLICDRCHEPRHPQLHFVMSRVMVYRVCPGHRPGLLCLLLQFAGGVTSPSGQCWVIGQNVCMARACQLRPAQPFLGVIGQNVWVARPCQLRPALPFLAHRPSSALRPVSYSAGPRGFSFTLGAGAGRGFLSCFWAVCQGWWGNSVKAFRCHSTAVRAWFSFIPRWRRRSSLIPALTPPSRRDVVRATVDFSSCW